MLALRYSAHMAFLAASMSLVSAICPGYNFAFWNIGSKWYYVTDVSCNRVLTAVCDNPCTCGAFSCSPDPAYVNGVTIDGLYYNCRDDPNKGVCDPPGDLVGQSPESCCRNDGRRNFAEGLITERHFEAISATNEILDRHIVEYDDAVVKGRNLEMLRARQLVEVEESVKREAEVAQLAE